jgi:hypothetical protein
LYPNCSYWHKSGNYYPILINFFAVVDIDNRAQSIGKVAFKYKYIGSLLSHKIMIFSLCTLIVKQPLNATSPKMAVDAFFWINRMTHNVAGLGTANTTCQTPPCIRKRVLDNTFQITDSVLISWKISHLSWEWCAFCVRQFPIYKSWLLHWALTTSPWEVYLLNK